MGITGFDILVSFIRMCMTSHLQTMVFESVMQIMVSSYGFLGAMYMKTCYLAVYFAICMISTIIRLVCLYTYVMHPYGFGDDISWVTINGTNTEEPATEHVNGVYMMVTMLLLSAFLMQWWIAHITYYLRQDILKFQHVVRHRIFVNVAV